MAGSSCRKKIACNAAARIASNELDVLVMEIDAMIEEGKLDKKQEREVLSVIDGAILHAERMESVERSFIAKLHEIIGQAPGDGQP